MASTSGGGGYEADFIVQRMLLSNATTSASDTDIGSPTSMKATMIVRYVSLCIIGERETPPPHSSDVAR